MFIGESILQLNEKCILTATKIVEKKKAAGSSGALFSISAIPF